MRFALLVLSLLFLPGPASPPPPSLSLHPDRSSTSDLEVFGRFADNATTTTRYLRYEELLQLPQETHQVTDDANFPNGAEVRGVPLLLLTEILGQQDKTAVAICDDGYRAHLSHDYMVRHHPLLVLEINGKTREQWPEAPGGGTLGPYLISHPFFRPSFQVLSEPEEPRIPYGVLRLEFHREAEIYGPITPRGHWSPRSKTEEGFLIARQDCFKCHNMGGQGGTKAGRSWMDIAAVAKRNGVLFRQIVRDPVSVHPNAQMPAHNTYDDATLQALTAYFRQLAHNSEHLQREAINQ